MEFPRIHINWEKTVTANAATSNVVISNQETRTSKTQCCSWQHQKAGQVYDLFLFSFINQPMVSNLMLLFSMSPFFDPPVFDVTTFDVIGYSPLILHKKVLLLIQLDRKQIEFLSIQANDYLNMDSEKRSGKTESAKAKWKSWGASYINNGNVKWN